MNKNLIEKGPGWDWRGRARARFRICLGGAWNMVNFDSWWSLSLD